MIAFARAYLDALLVVAHDGGALLVLVVAPLVYAVFYPQAYALQKAQHLPVVIVDDDRSALSRTLLRHAAASPNLQLLGVADDLRHARQLLDAGAARGALVIPRGTERDVGCRRQAHAVVLGNGASSLVNTTTSSAFAAVVLGMNAELDVRYRLGGKQSRAQPSRNACR